MDIHEYQAKELLANFGVAVPRGGVAYSAEQAVYRAAEIGGARWAVKAQIHSGARGKAGGIKLCGTEDEVRTAATELLGKRLVTHQTGPEGKVVHRLYVEAAVPIEREMYIGFVLDRKTERIMLVAHPHGGVEIEEIAKLNIGSRPASRKASAHIEDLRAIPWVFSWAQCRLMLPGWYGFGAAVKAWLAKYPDNGMATLKEMYREWPFFTALLSNMDMVLAKSDIAIASRYANLVTDVQLRDSVFARLSAEWQDTIDMLLAVTGQHTLLESNALLARSIRHRFPYLDPLNHMQLELLKRYRAGDATDNVVQGIHLTINGIAAGLRNSG
mgnify:CR=1 FL=1